MKEEKNKKEQKEQKEQEDVINLVTQIELSDEELDNINGAKSTFLPHK